MVIDWLIECKETTEDTLSNQPVSVRTLSHSTFTSFSVNVPPLRSLSICSSSWSTSGRGIVAGVCLCVCLLCRSVVLGKWWQEREERQPDDEGDKLVPIRYITVSLLHKYRKRRT